MHRISARNLAIAAFLLLTLAAAAAVYWRYSSSDLAPYRFVSTVAGIRGEFGEPFGIAVKDNEIYVADGANGRIWRIKADAVSLFAEGLDTPSGIAFDKNGDLLVADSGSHAIKTVDSGGQVTIIAGVEGRSGFADGDAALALFNAPIGIAAGGDGRIYVADSYNDRVRMIENGVVSTLAGTSFGYADGVGSDAKFDTPCGLAIWHDKLLVADSGNRRVRVVEPDGRVWTLAGTGELALKDGLLSLSSFVQPTAIAVDHNGAIILADGNAIRQIGGDVIPMVRTISDETRGLRDGRFLRSRFNRLSGIAIDDTGDLLVADSDNRLVRHISSKRSGHQITADEVEALRDKPDKFRNLQPPRWPYDPPTHVREIAGTLGELRGDVPEQSEPARFHNGLDIAGAYGETARYIRDEKVLLPIAAANFGTLRESLRMPSLGYIHVRLGRDASGKPFDDARFQFETDALGKPVGVRVPRGTRFKAGEPIGILNQMNHVHLIAGRSGSEMNALNALILPGLRDTRPPVIEDVQFISEDRMPFGKDQLGRVQVGGKMQIIMLAYDQVDGNAARRRLGIYQAGYQLLRPDRTPFGDFEWTIRFDRLPRFDAAKLVYADGSHSGATGETVFKYLVTNRVEGDTAAEGYFDASALDAGAYVMRVIAADQFGNQTFVDTPIEVKK